MPNVEKLKEYSDATIKWGGKHWSLLKGLGALLFGVLLVYLSHKLIINLIVFSFGLLLIYFGMKELKLKKLTDFADKMVDKIRKFF